MKINYNGTEYTVIVNSLKWVLTYSVGKVSARLEFPKKDYPTLESVKAELKLGGDKNDD